MDVSGKDTEATSDVKPRSDVQLGSTFLAGSDEAPYDPVCGECVEIDQCVIAAGYCIECEEYLCHACIRHHGRSKSSRDHPIMEGDAMPQPNPQDSDVEICPDHPGTPVDLYCPTDGTVGCGTCFIKGHKKCAKPVFISKMCKQVNSSTEYKELERLQTQMSQKIKEHRDLIKSYRLVNQSCCEETERDFDAYKENVKTKLYLEGIKLSTDSKEMKERNKLKLDSYSKSLVKLEQTNNMTLSIFKSYQLGQEVKRFIAVTKGLKQIKESGHKLDQMKKEIYIRRYTFEAGAALRRLIGENADAGKLKEWSGGVTCTGEIKVKSSDDKKICHISDIIKLSSTEIVVVDNCNHCLKQIDVVIGTISYRRSLASVPVCITTIPGTRVAVTLPGLQQIQLFTTDGTLTSCGTVGVAGLCLGIACTGDRLIVSYWKPGKIQIMDLGGQVFNTFTSDTAGNQLFDNPEYLSVSPDHSAIYVSDSDRNTVTCLGTDGTVNWTYKAEDLKRPRGVTTGGDCSLYICSDATHSLHVLTTAGGRLETIPVKQYNIRFPNAIYYCKEEGALYVSSSSSDPKESDFVRRLTFE